MKTHETKPSISRFSANAWLRSQSDYVKQVLILCVKSAKGCRVAEWFVNPRLAKMQWKMNLKKLDSLKLLSILLHMKIF